MASTIDSTSPEDNGALNQGRAPWHAFVPPWLMSLPAFILFAVLVLTPLAMTVVLTFYRFDPASGPIAAFQFGNYVEVLTDSYYQTIFARTFGIAILTTLLCVAIGAPEAYVLYRMRDPWRSMFLLVILAPLLVSVVVRAFGWSMLLNTGGIVNQFFGALRDGSVQAGVHHVRDRDRARSRDAAVHGDPRLDLAAEARSAG